MRKQTEVRNMQFMETIRLAQRMRALHLSDIRRMTLECERLDGINLGQGICDLPTIPELKEGLDHAVKANKSTYSRYDGIPELRLAIGERLEKKNGISYSTEDEIVVTVGATGAFAMAMMAILDPGDEVLLPEPFYGYHWNTILAAGGVPKPVPLREPDYAVDFEAMARAVTTRTRALVVSSPANPMGKIWDTQELDHTVKFLVDYDLWGITDEIYEDILYDGHQHHGLASRPGARDRTITISGFSKTFSITGWRMGFAAAPRSMAAAIGILNDLYYVCAPTPLQHAVAHAITRVPGEYYQSLRKDYERKRNLLVDTCRQLGWNPRVPSGAYYLMVEPKGLQTTSAREASNRILADARVASVPGSAFYADGGGENLVRFSFAKTEEDLRTACRLLNEAFG